MRDDLDFLYKKAMRSGDYEFMVDVFYLLVDAEKTEMSDKLTDRIVGFIRRDVGIVEFSIFSFLIGDSQMGENWYRTK